MYNGYRYQGYDSIPQEKHISLSTWFLAYILADKLCIKEARIPLMSKFMLYFIPEVVFSTTIPQILSEVPDCAATNYVIAEVGWEFAESGYDWLMTVRTDTMAQHAAGASLS